MPPVQLFVVSHTHWDREWYLPFQLFRIKLVDTIDRLLALFDSEPEFRSFTLDGQTIVLEDYLAVRPERADDIRRLVTEGRLLIGPWYVQPDQFLVSGEAIVRNLLRGRRIAERFGGIMRVGYLPDPFGHVAQMPQILRGFGIEDAVVWRGVGEDVHYNEFLWRSPDGSEVLTEYLPEGYDNALRLPADADQLLAYLSHVREVLEPRSQSPHLLLMNGDDHAPAQEDVHHVLELANERLSDARAVHASLPQFFVALRRAAMEGRLAFETTEGELRSPRYAHLLPGVLSSRLWIKQRNAASQTLLERWVEPFCAFADRTGARIEARALLDLAWGHLLQNHAHDSICGCSIDQVHDEMRGRFDAVDQIAGSLAERALGSIASKVNTLGLPAPVGYARPASSELFSGLVVFNGEAGPRTDYVGASLQLPGGLDDVAVADDAGHLIPSQLLAEKKVEEYSRTLSRNQLRGLLRLAGIGRDWTPDRVRMLHRMLTTMAGSKLPSLVVEDVAIKPGQDPDTVLVEARTAATGEHNYEALSVALRDVSALIARGDIEYVHLRALRRDEVELGFVATDVPGHGYRTFQLLPGHRQRGVPGAPLPGDAIENEFYSVRANPSDGTLSVIDKQTGAASSGLNALRDGGDAGDEYNYSPPDQDREIDGNYGQVVVQVTESGPVRSRLRVSYELLLPASLSEDRSGRSTIDIACPVVMEVSLYAHVRRIDITATIENRAQDHRLRVLFPTRIGASHSHAETSFGVVERPVTVPPGGDAWLERPMGTYPQQRFVDVSDGEVGLAIANRGLSEYEVLPGRDGVTIALTLLRCVGWLSRDDLTTRRGSAGPSLPTPGAQMLGQHVFHYSLIPHAGDWDRIVAQAHAFANPLRAVATGLHPGELPPSAPFISVQPEGIVVSAVKAAEDGDGLIVRLYNPGAAHALARIETMWPIDSASLCTIGEEHLSSIQTDGQSLGVPVRAAQIVTLRLRFAA